MKRLILFLFSVSLLAQSPQNWGGAFASYNQFSSPQVSGGAAFASLISQKGPIYTFTEYQITSAKTHPWTAQTSTTTGVATPLKSYDFGKAGTWNLTVFGLATGGLATSGSTVGGAFAGGGVAILKLASTNWDVFFGMQYLSTTVNKQSVYSFGLGRSF